VLRSGRVKRETKETKVDVTISIDGTGRCKAKTPIHFLNHMLDVSTVREASAYIDKMGPVTFFTYARPSQLCLQQISSHGLFDLNIEAEGDTWIDDHHTNEDLGTLEQKYRIDYTDCVLLHGYIT